MNGDATTPSWYYAKAGAVDGQQVGPIAWEQLYSLTQTGALTSADLVWNPQLPSWVTVAEVPGLLPPPLPPRDTSQETVQPTVVQPTAARPGGVQPTVARPGGVQPTVARPGVVQAAPSTRQPARQSSSQDPFLDDDGMDDFGGGRSWFRWGIAGAAVVVIAVIVGVYFGVIRGGSAETTTTLPAATTTSESITTTTEPIDMPMTDAVWMNLAPAGDVPSPRSNHATAYDSAAGNIILFGGWDANGTYNDTWLYDSNLDTWTNLNPQGTLPAARAQHQMVYDPVGGKVIMFGGVVALSGAQLGDTWAYDPLTNTWADLQPQGEVPSARDSFTMVYDSANQKIILFGGWSNTTNGHLNDTWAYDPAQNTWTNLNPGGDVPTVRGSHAMAYDPEEAKIILFGGWDENAYFNDTYAYDPATNTWANMGTIDSAPAVRAGHRMTYDPTSGTIILFGGWDGAAYFDDTWAYDAAVNVWTDLNPAGDAPAPRDSHSLVYDSATDELILFGGFVGGAADAQDTWSFGTQGAQQPPSTIPESTTSTITETTTTM